MRLSTLSQREGCAMTVTTTTITCALLQEATPASRPKNGNSYRCRASFHLVEMGDAPPDRCGTKFFHCLQASGDSGRTGGPLALQTAAPNVVGQPQDRTVIDMASKHRFKPLRRQRPTSIAVRRLCLCSSASFRDLL